VNTRIIYEYRDGANYRFHSELVVAGEMTEALWARIRAACQDGDRFIADQVGLPEVFGFLPGDHIYAPEYAYSGYPFDQEVDHCWHHLAQDPDGWELTGDEPTGALTVELLVNAFEQAAAVGWRVFDPAERFGL
jgi:hypothetical protein